MTRSLTTLPNNTTTSQTAEVYSAAGFNAGDLVYYQGGDYKGAGSLTTSNNVVFSNTVNLNTSTSFGNAAISSVFPTTSATSTGSTGGRFAAVLTNGNIVQAFANTGPTPGAGTTKGIYFQIVNTSGVVQVAPTRVGATTATYGYSIEVAALTGGGFVVVYINVSAQISYAIYTNTGTVTTAVTTDTGITVNTAQRIRVIGLANGGFAIATQNSSTGFVSIRSYGATGTAAYAWVSTGVTSASLAAPFGLSARSDSSTIVAFLTSATSIVYYLHNSSGTLITNNAISISTANTSQPTDVICLADGTTYVIGYFNPLSPTVPCFRLLPTGNSLGSQITIPAANFNSGNSTVNANAAISLLAQASGGFAMVFGDYFNAFSYAFFNASGTAVSGTNGSGTLPITIPVARASYDYYVTMIEITGYVNLYWTIGLYNQSQPNPNQSFAQINSATYALVPQTSTVSGVLGTATLAAGTGIVSVATPSNAKFYPAATTSNSYSSSIGAIVLSPTTISSTACHSTSACTLPNGQFVIAYAYLGSPYSVFANVYSSAGSLVTTIAVAANGGAYLGSVKVAALSSGKFVVGWNTGGTTVNLNLYSSTFTQIGTTKTLTLGSTYSPTQYNYDLVGLGGNSDRYVVGYINASTYPGYAVYDNTNTVVAGPSNVIAAVKYNIRVAADAAGGFAVSYLVGTSYYMTQFIQTAATTYTVNSVNDTIFSPTTASYNQQHSLIYANNGYYAAVSDGSNAIGSHIPINAPGGTNVSLGNLVNSLITDNHNYTQAFGLNGNGNVIFVSQYTTSNANMYVIFGGNSYSTTAASAGTSTPVNYTSAIATTNNTTTYCGYSICPSTGNNFVLAWLDSSNFPTFAIYNALALSGSFTVTAGVSQSNVTSIQPTASTSTSVVPSTMLAGVAVTSATAGSTGQLAINGLAQLNSNYPSGTNQAFDYTGQAIDGVKGVINGRTVNMQGNS